MSLWCGSCRSEIFAGFGILYQLERTNDGKLRFPDKSKDYVPANSAICDPCWLRLPASEKYTDESMKITAEQSEETVFAYAPADSNNDAFWGSKTWSGIVTDDGKLVLVKSQAVSRYFPKAVEIIDGMARSRSA